MSVRLSGRRAFPNVSAIALLAAMPVLFQGRAAAQDIAVTLDFDKQGQRITALDGASACQFDIGTRHGGYNSVEWLKNGVAASNYSKLEGFPEDVPTTGFGRFVDAAFGHTGPYGGAYQNLWVTPCPRQVPEGGLGNTYATTPWSKMDFSVYESSAVFRDGQGWRIRGSGVARGHTVVMLQAAVRRARDANARMVLWIDLHFSWPTQVWKSTKEYVIIPEANWEEAALYHVFFAKYLAAKHGIPIHAISFVNEPNVGGGVERSNWTMAQLAKFPTVLRRKLEEAGMPGIKLMPGTPFRWKDDGPKIMAELKKNPEWMSEVDIVAGHHWDDTPLPRTALEAPLTQAWLGSGSFHTGDVDSDIRRSISRLAEGLDLVSHWQYASHLTGSTPNAWDDNYAFSPEKVSKPALVHSGPAVYPFVRPGMALVSGSLKGKPSATHSVDGFAGRGHREAIVITNDGSTRRFRIKLSNLSAESFEAYQATNSSARKKLADVQAQGGTLTLSVPGNSVTTLVAKQAETTRPRAYLIVGNSSSLTAADKAASEGLAKRGFEVKILGQSLSEAEKTAHNEKRHPIDAMGAACYVISSSVDSDLAVQAHDVVMAPVLVLGDSKRELLGLAAGATVKPGEALSLRRPLDPPESLLSGGKPKATGYRRSLSAGATVDAVAKAAADAMPFGGAVTAPADTGTTRVESLAGRSRAQRAAMRVDLGSGSLHFEAAGAVRDGLGRRPAR